MRIVNDGYLWLVAWLVGSLVGWFVGLLARRLHCWLAGAIQDDFIWLLHQGSSLGCQPKLPGRMQFIPEFENTPFADDRGGVKRQGTTSDIVP